MYISTCMIIDFYMYYIICIYISVLLTDPNASPVIQTLLLVLHKNDLGLCQKYIHKVIKSSRIKDIEKGDNTDHTKYVCMKFRVNIIKMKVDFNYRHG